MNLEEEMVIKYWKTLIRKNVSNIPLNKFIKKPYLENYIIKLSVITNDKDLVTKITSLINNDKVNNEELFLFMNNNFEFDNKKKEIEKFFLDNNTQNEEFNKLSIEILIYQTKYFRFYQTVTELLFDSVSEDNELYNFILIYIKNKNSEIKNYTKKNIKFAIFYHYIKELENEYDNIFKLLIDYKLLTIEYNKKDILNLFLKNLFINWYSIYKTDISEDRVNEKIKDHVLSKGIISRLLCLPNI
jgi:hypothetical protein